MASTPASASSPACASPTPTSPSSNATSCCRTPPASASRPRSPATRLMMALKLGSLAQGRVGRAPETLALLEGDAGARRDAGRAGARVGRRLGRPRAARPHGGGDDRRRRGALRRRRPARGGRARTRGARAAASSARRRGSRSSTARNSRPPMRSPACSRSSACFAPRSSPARSRPTRRAAPTRRSIRAFWRCAAIAGPSEVAAALRCADGGQRDPRIAPQRRSARAGPLLPALPAAGDGRLPRPSAPGRRDAGRRSQRRVRQSADLRRGRSALSGGNFHAEPVAFAADMIALAVCEIGSLAERRIAMLVDPALSGLPAFLTPRPGLNSGFMIPQVTAAALVSENKQRAYPASVDSIPTSANQEDHVSMAAHGARRLAPMARNAAHVVAIEALAAAQAIEFHAPLAIERRARERARAAATRRAAARGRPLLPSRHRRRRRRSIASGDFVAAGGRHPLAGARRRMTPGLARHRAARRAAHRQHPARRDGPRRLRAALRQPLARAQRDADWHLPALYDFAADLGATIVRTTISRSVIDVNRDPDGVSLYPGQATTELCPTTTFDGEPLYREGEAPGRGRDRRAPRALLRALSRGAASRDRPPAPSASARRALRRPFDPLGHPAPVRRRTAGLQSRNQFRRKLLAGFARRLAAALAASGRSFVVDGRFKGGWITRSSARPDRASRPCSSSSPAAPT